MSQVDYTLWAEIPLDQAGSNFESWDRVTNAFHAALGPHEGSGTSIWQGQLSCRDMDWTYDTEQEGLEAYSAALKVLEENEWVGLLRLARYPNKLVPIHPDRPDLQWDPGHTIVQTDGRSLND